MAQATSLTVLNTVTALGTDVQVGSNGYVTIKGAATSPDASNIREIVVTKSVAEQLQIDTVTFATLTAGADYNLSFKCFDTVSGNPVIVPVTVTATAATASVIAAQVVAAFNAFGSNLSVVASVSTNYAVFTAKAGFPAFLTAYYDSKMTLANTTAAIAGIGSGTSLQTKWSTSAGFYTAGIYAQSANIVATTYYSQVSITLLDGSQYAILVAESLTTAATPSIANYNDLLGTYGTITGLAAGYRVIGSALTTAMTAGALNSTTQVQTITGGTLASAVNLVGGDYLVSISTPVVSKVLGILSETTYVSSSTTALTSGSYLNAFMWRNLPA